MSEGEGVATTKMKTKRRSLHWGEMLVLNERLSSFILSDEGVEFISFTIAGSDSVLLAVFF